MSNNRKRNDEETRYGFILTRKEQLHKARCIRYNLINLQRIKLLKLQERIRINNSVRSAILKSLKRKLKVASKIAKCDRSKVVFSKTNRKPLKLQEQLHKRPGGSGVKSNNSKPQKNKRVHFESRGIHPKLLLLASYRVVYRVAKSKAPHTIAEELIRPCALDMVKTLLGQEATKVLEQVPLSNHHFISDLNDDLLDQVISGIRASPVKISLQLDESTDISNCRQLIALVRYVSNSSVEEDFLFCKELNTNTQGKDVYQFVKDFFVQHDLDIQKIGSVCTDGAAAMLGNTSGFSALMKREIPHLRVTHCFLHRPALAAKTLPITMKVVLDSCINMINWIKSRSLNHCFFKLVSKDLGNEHTTLLFHTEDRWLSRGTALTFFFTLREEIKVFLKEHGYGHIGRFESQNFLQRLAYLADIFSRMNDLSVSLRRENTNILICYEKMKYFKEQLSRWCHRVERGDLSNFPSLEESVGDNGSLIPSVLLDIVAHLKMLSESFDGYFTTGELNISEKWIKDPYFYINNMSDDDDLKGDLIELQTDRALMMQFLSKTCLKNSLENYWCSVMNVFPKLGKKALDVLIPFSNTKLCESAFISLLTIKRRSRSGMNLLQAEMRIAVSNKIPRTDKIIDKRQRQIYNPSQ